MDRNAGCPTLRSFKGWNASHFDRAARTRLQRCFRPDISGGLSSFSTGRGGCPERKKRSYVSPRHSRPSLEALFSRTGIAGETQERSDRSTSYQDTASAVPWPSHDSRGFSPLRLAPKIENPPLTRDSAHLHAEILEAFIPAGWIEMQCELISRQIHRHRIIRRHVDRRRSH